MRPRRPERQPAAERPSAQVTTCDGTPIGATFASILCRLDTLLTAVNGEPDLGTFRPKLAQNVEKAIARTGEGGTLCGAANVKKTKKRLQQAGTALRQYAHRLSGLAARKKLDSTLRQAFLDAAAPIRDDLKALRSAVACPDDAPPG